MTENQLREYVVSIMRSFIGAADGNSKHLEILNIFNSSGKGDVYMTADYAWCATTVSAAGIKAGLTSIIPPSASCTKMIAKNQALGQWVENDAYIPKKGDIIMYEWDDSGYGDCNYDADHVGMVEAVSGNTITVIEGNMGYGYCGRRDVTVNQRYIRGFITPNYAKVANGVSDTTNKTTTSAPKPANIDLYIRVRTEDGKWSAEVKNGTAGTKGKKITDICMKASKGKLRYQVFSGGKWQEPVTGYNINDYNNGYAGIHKPINAVRAYYETPDDVRPYQCIYYAVAPVNGDFYDIQCDEDITGNMEGFAGDLENKTIIDRIKGYIK